MGVSPDPVDSHKAFKDKYALPFTLLADTDRGMLRVYDVVEKRNAFGKTVERIMRTTYVLDGDGEIIQVFENVNADGHSKEVLAFLDNG